MKKGKKIDELFREEVRYQEIIPPEEIWLNISSQLDRQREKRAFLFPLWLPWATSAAVVALLVTLAGSHFPKDAQEECPEVVTSLPEGLPKDISEGFLHDPESKGATPALFPMPLNLSEEKNGVVSESLWLENELSQTGGPTRAKVQKGIPGEFSPPSSVEGSHGQERFGHVGAGGSAQVSGLAAGGEDSFTTGEISEGITLAEGKQSPEDQVENKDSTFPKKIKPNGETGIAQGGEETSPQGTFSEGISLAKGKPAGPTRVRGTASRETSEITERDNDLQKGGSKRKTEGTEANALVLSPITPEGLRELQQENGFHHPSLEESRKAALFGFSISTNVGAVYAGDPGGSQGSDVSMAYGIGVAYQISEHINIRTGAGKVSPNHSTRELYDASYANGEPFRFPVHSIQEMDFIEVPLEMEYALVQKRLGLSLITGGSTYFLQRNELLVDSPFSTEEMGTTEDLNRLSFSANIGLGLFYRISRHFRWGLEPIFKFQMKPYRNEPSKNLYYFGIHSGLSYKF